MRTLRSPLTQKSKKSVKDYSAGNSDMIGLPGTKFRENVDKEVKDYIAKNKTKTNTKTGTKPTAAPKQLKSVKRQTASSKPAPKMKKC